MIRVGILTISDRSARGERADASGPAIQSEIDERGWEVAITIVIPDNFDQITKTLIQWCDELRLDIILTSGGTGLSPRDVTPEATRAVFHRDVPGLSEVMRLGSQKVTPHAMLSRGCCGIRERTLIINLPGSPKAAIENLRIVLPVLPHAVELLRDATDAESGHSRLNH